MVSGLNSNPTSWKNRRNLDSDILYVGEIRYGLPHGQGSLTWRSGDKYIGKFKDGKPHGQGTLIYSWGQKYVGEWKDGKFIGNQ